jgi:hypothetical protein
MTVDETIVGWTDEEREDLKDLIDDCRQREKMIERARIESMRGLMRLTDNVIGELAEEILKRIRDRIKGTA